MATRERSNKSWLDLCFMYYAVLASKTCVLELLYAPHKSFLKNPQLTPVSTCLPFEFYWDTGLCYTPFFPSCFYLWNQMHELQSSCGITVAWLCLSILSGTIISILWGLCVSCFIFLLLMKPSLLEGLTKPIHWPVNWRCSWTPLSGGQHITFTLWVRLRWAGECEFRSIPYLGVSHLAVQWTATTPSSQLCWRIHY